MLEASIILSFYNDLPLLRLVLEALATQYAGQFEVLIADDGSESQVVQSLKQWLPACSFPVTHLWHTDQGFRKTTALNHAVVKARGDCLIFVDADCVPQSHFVSDHLRQARRGLCQTGRRVNVPRQAIGQLHCSAPGEIVHRNLGTLLRWSMSGGAHAVEKGLRLPTRLADALTRLFPRPFGGVLGCNFSVSREDLLRVNGFDERFSVQWGAEDSDIERRLRKAGIDFRQLRAQATMIHFDASFHNRRMPKPEAEQNYFEQVAQENRAWTPYGIVKAGRPESVAKTDF